MLAPEFPASMLIIPATHARLCGKRVLTMTWVDGVRLDDQAALEAQGIDRRAVAALLQRLFASMIFVHGFVHCVRTLLFPYHIFLRLIGFTPFPPPPPRILTRATSL